MNQKQKDHFENKAKEYDKEVARGNNVTNIANLILKEISFRKDSNIMDFGSGTGLLLSKIAPFVGKITAIDISKSMNDVLIDKKDVIECDLEIIELDLTKEKINQTFDGIISSMTIHHIKDTEQLFKTFYGLLNENGTIALADLDEEDGSFHKVDTGVFHFGFNREVFLNIAKKVGFKDLKLKTVGLVEKPYGNYSVFLLTGKK